MYIYLSIFIYLYLYLYLHPYLYLCPSICLYLHLNLYLYLYLSICLSMYACMYGCMYLSIYLPIHPSIYLATIYCISIYYLLYIYLYLSHTHSSRCHFQPFPSIFPDFPSDLAEPWLRWIWVKKQLHLPISQESWKNCGPLWQEIPSSWVDKSLFWIVSSHNHLPILHCSHRKTWHD